MAHVRSGVVQGRLDLRFSRDTMRTMCAVHGGYPAFQLEQELKLGFRSAENGTGRAHEKDTLISLSPKVDRWPFSLATLISRSLV